MKLSDFSQVNDFFGPGVTIDLRGFIQANVSVAEAFAVAKILYPEFVEYRDGIFLKDFFESSAVDVWLDKLKNMRAVESVVNHVHLWDIFSPASAEDNRGLVDLLELMNTSWPALLLNTFPGREFEITATNDPEDYGPTLSFCQQ